MDFTDIFLESVYPKGKWQSQFSFEEGEPKKLGWFEKESGIFLEIPSVDDKEVFLFAELKKAGLVETINPQECIRRCRYALEGTKVMNIIKIAQRWECKDMDVWATIDFICERAAELFNSL